ncbi:tetratricopeptide repeat protein [Pelatocladus sp. BLCC-F211]|uniref:tetratricopeptide repeat protein n=1 Tax=Pelatocladus sp. BLCC-F211 TaxID=3342752 RepID=UPI0035BBB827
MVIFQKDYEELGGAVSSLVQKADSEYTTLVQQHQSYEQIVCNVMLRMVAVDDGKLRRRPVPLSELDYPEPANIQVQEVIERFCTAGLLVMRKDGEGKPYVEATDDALVNEWCQLLEWKQKYEESLILQRRLTPAAMKWKREQKAKFLWNSDRSLNLLKQILHSDDNWLNLVETEFVHQSVLQRRKNLALRGSFAFGFGLLAIFTFVVYRESLITQSCDSEKSHSSNPLSLFTPLISPPTPCSPAFVSTTTTVTTAQNQPVQPPLPLTIIIEDFYTRGNEKTNKSEQQKVIQTYNRVISKNPRDINAYINRGIAYYRQDQYDQAITNYTQALSINQNIHAYINRGIAYHRQGKYELAIADYNKALSIKSNSVDGYINRGITYRRQEKYKLAMADFNKAISIDSNNGDAYYALGLTYTQLGNQQAAIASYRLAAHLYQQKRKTSYQNNALTRIKGLQ